MNNYNGYEGFTTFTCKKDNGILWVTIDFPPVNLQGQEMLGDLNTLCLRLERDQEITTEALALFVRFWLTTTPPLPDDTYAAAKAKGKERYGGFVQTLSRRLAKGSTLTKELSHDRSS